MKNLGIKDHVYSCINDFRERIRAICSRPFELKKKDEEEGGEQSAFLQFSENHCSCIFYVYYNV